MSSTTNSNANGTTIVFGPDIIQISDFYVKAGVLHPILVGSIAILTLFVALRIGSNRSIAPLTPFDWLITVALGSTLAGIVNGNSLVRGLLALATLLIFQYATSTLTARFPVGCGQWLSSRPLVVAFRGELLFSVLRKHRISADDIYVALRQRKVLSIRQVACIVIEPNGKISVITTADLESVEGEQESLMRIPAYKALCDPERQCKADGNIASKIVDKFLV